MIDDKLCESAKSSMELLKYIFSDWEKFVKEIAPNGWEQSQYRYFLHPTPEQRFDEYKRIRENIDRLMSKLRKDKIKEPEKTLEDFQKEYNEPQEINTKEEFIYILGLCIWDIFSDNHDVISPNGKVHDLGSFRGSGGFIADFINYNFDDISQKYDYIDFYMGTIWIHNRADLSPFYEYIFQKLKERGCNWKYSFPRLHLVDLKKIADTNKEEITKPEDYDPYNAVVKELEEKEAEEQKRKLKKELDEMYEESYEDAKYKKPPKVVLAYKKIFGEMPEGHPQKNM